MSEKKVKINQVTEEKPVKSQKLDDSQQKKSKLSSENLQQKLRGSFETGGKIAGHASSSKSISGKYCNSPEFSAEEIEKVIKMILCCMSVEKSRSAVVANGMRLVLTGQSEISDIILSEDLSEQEIIPHVDAARKILVCSRNRALQKAPTRKLKYITEQTLDSDIRKGETDKERNVKMGISEETIETRVEKKEPAESHTDLTSDGKWSTIEDKSDINAKDDIDDQDFLILKTIPKACVDQAKNNQHECGSQTKKNDGAVVASQLCSECLYQKEAILTLQKSLDEAKREIEKLRNLTPKEFFQMREIRNDSKNMMKNIVQSLEGDKHGSGTFTNASNATSLSSEKNLSCPLPYHRKSRQNMHFNPVKSPVVPLLQFRGARTRKGARPRNSNFVPVNRLSPGGSFGRISQDRFAELIRPSPNMTRSLPVRESEHMQRGKRCNGGSPIPWDAGRSRLAASHPGIPVSSHACRYNMAPRGNYSYQSFGDRRVQTEFQDARYGHLPNRDAWNNEDRYQRLTNIHGNQYQDFGGTDKDQVAAGYRNAAPELSSNSNLGICNEEFWEEYM